MFLVSHRCRAALLLIIFALSGVATAQTLPTPTWPIPGLPNEDGSSRFPMWTGESYLDSAISTGAVRLHEIGIRGQGVSVATYDMVYDTNNEYIRNNIIDEACVNFSVVGPGEYPYDSSMQYGGTIDGKDLYIGRGKESVQAVATLTEYIDMHGTHVAGIIVGMAPESGLVLTHSSNWLDPDSRTDADLNMSFGDTGNLLALRHVVDHADQYNIVAMNNSYATNYLPYAVDDANKAETENPEMAAALKALRTQGVLPVFSSANSSWNNYIATPPIMNDAIAVGNLHPWGLFAVDTNQNAKIALMAPGTDILSSVPEWMNGGQDLGLMSGTSMAAPHVSGAIALLASGARNASTEEILDSLLESADRVVYDGSLELRGDLFVHPSWVDPVTGEPIVKTLDEWRHLFFDRMKEYLLSEGIDIGIEFEPMEQLEYRFLRVDKAYMDLTEKRTHDIAEQVGKRNDGLSSVLHAYAEELGTDINRDTADVFQRLDIRNLGTQIVVARKMSPLFTHAVIESAHLGLVGLHRFLGRQTEFNRLGQGANYSSTCDPCTPRKRSHFKVGRTESRAWIEGLGSALNKNGTTSSGAYDGHFAGTSFGIERTRNGNSLGLFGSWSNHRIDGDGIAQGDWGSVGLYGRLDRKRGFLEGSISYNYGDYDLKREIFIPGVVFSSYRPSESIVLDPLSKRADSVSKIQGFSTRIAAGRDIWTIRGWNVGPRTEMSLSYLASDGYTEQGADSLNLTVDRYETTYLEGGIGLIAGKKIQAGSHLFVATGKLMGMYGGTMGEDLSGRFVQYGHRFTVKPNRLSTAWIAPEATLAWNLREGVVLSASYFGRLGETYHENAGSIGLNLYW